MTRGKGKQWEERHFCTRLQGVWFPEPVKGRLILLQGSIAGPATASREYATRRAPLSRLQKVGAQ